MSSSLTATGPGGVQWLEPKSCRRTPSAGLRSTAAQPEVLIVKEAGTGSQGLSWALPHWHQTSAAPERDLQAVQVSVFCCDLLHTADSQEGPGSAAGQLLKCSHSLYQLLLTQVADPGRRPRSKTNSKHPQIHLKTNLLPQVLCLSQVPGAEPSLHPEPDSAASPQHTKRLTHTETSQNTSVKEDCALLSIHNYCTCLQPGKAKHTHAKQLWSCH